MGQNTYPIRQKLVQVRADKLPPGASSYTQTWPAGGTSYTVTVGTPALLPVSVELAGDKVLDTAGHLAGPTTARPNYLTDGDMPAPPVGLLYLDTTLNKCVVFDGLNWRDVFSGAIE